MHKFVECNKTIIITNYYTYIIFIIFKSMRLQAKAIKVCIKLKSFSSCLLMSSSFFFFSFLDSCKFVVLFFRVTLCKTTIQIKN